MLLVAEATALDDCVDQSDAHLVLEAFQDLLEGVGATMGYETEFVSHTTPNDALDDSLTQSIESSNLSVDPFYEDLTKAFRYRSSADLGIYVTSHFFA